MSGDDAAALAADWLRFAREDLVGAEADLTDRRAHAPRHVCFGAQQAAEKAIKAMLVARQMRFPLKHDLEELANLLDDAAAELRPADLAELSEWAVASRYPDFDEPAWADAERAAGAARRIVEIAVRDIEGEGRSGSTTAAGSSASSGRHSK
jgi:HEPN domain-containing protein